LILLVLCCNYSYVENVVQIQYVATTTDPSHPITADAVDSGDDSLADIVDKDSDNDGIADFF